MINEKIKSIYTLMERDEEAAAKLAGIASPTEAVEILAGYGIAVTIDDLKELVNQVDGDELPVELLDMVSGGGKARDFFWGFCDGLRESFNQIKSLFK